MVTMARSRARSRSPRNYTRWREAYGIVNQVTGMKLKVPWNKLKRRIRVFLDNIFRLRAFWYICHPVVEMRFLSLDQKPSWFNNAGHTGTFAKKGGSQPSVREIYAHTRLRYSILTSVQSWDNTDQDNPHETFKNETFKTDQERDFQATCSSTEEEDMD